MANTIVQDQMHELNDFENAQWNEPNHNDQSLPRADGGKDAWLFLASCFVLEALIWVFIVLRLEDELLTWRQASPTPSVSFKRTIAPMSPSRSMRAT
ncbi:hypothetical protein LTR78_008663 [Recurvomyces mirabilis]|uniref:Uncharacterized protein n=1 Tax=Recurvomyces mirabilis TaxID=574656 RepID=A0AAE0WGU9_9PEZI|nr:hypothetical protein LTR78_008663 [Recurvomyces mirabilis]KAK5159252.1 hypothetical protein LTS14_002394 [Recurvomyces mirabilis]